MLARLTGSGGTELAVARWALLKSPHNESPPKSQRVRRFLNDANDALYGPLIP